MSRYSSLPIEYDDACQERAAVGLLEGERDDAGPWPDHVAAELDDKNVEADACWASAMCADVRTSEKRISVRIWVRYDSVLVDAETPAGMLERSLGRTLRRSSD